MSNKKNFALLAVVLLFALCSCEAAGMGGKKPGNLNAGNKGKGRIIVNSDGSSFMDDIFTNRQVPKENTKLIRELLEDMIDEHAKAQVDTFAYCLFCSFQSYVPSKVANWVPYMPKIHDADFDFVEVMMDRCRHNGMQFMASIRMNDRHGGDCMGQFMIDNPQWLLKGVPAHNPGMDYAYRGVREAMLTFVTELLDTFDVDGIELDYMRWCHMFEPGKGRENAHLLNTFTKKVRKLMDDAAKRRGRKRLELGVRVPQTLEGCEYLGLDVATWIKTGLVDWVVPGDFLYTDFNIRIDQFAKLAKGTDCEIYAGVHPIIAWGLNESLMTLANYRAVAKTAYADGADGISPFNYMYQWDKRRGTNYPGPGYMWPGALGYLRQIRDIEQVNAGDRHYLFYPLWNKQIPWMPPAGHYNDDRIHLDRSGQLQGSQSFRLAEDFTDQNLRGSIQFKAVNLTETENLQIQINGTKVPNEFVTRIFEKRELSYGRGETRVLPAFYYYWIDLNWGKVPIINGDNKLTVRLVPTEDQSHREVLIDELEVYVYVRK